MADVALQTAPLILKGVDLGAVHFDELWDPAKERIKRARGLVAAGAGAGAAEAKTGADELSIRERRTMEDQGYVLRRRRDVGPDEEIVATVRHRGEQLPRSPDSRRVRGDTKDQQPRRASSVGELRRAGVGGAAAGAAAGALVASRRRRGGRDRDDDDGASDSEGSPPPPSRSHRGRAKSATGYSKSGGGSSGKKGRRSTSSSSSSTSTSSLGSSSGEEKEIRKLKRKKWITAALASVATIHAAQKVYSSIENHDRRIREVEQGQLSPQEAAKKQRSAYWQDAAAVGIAALGIQGAMSEWREVSEEHAHHMELMREKEEHHKRRLEHERRKRARQQQTGYYQGRDGKWYYDGPEPQSSALTTSTTTSSSLYRSSSNRYDDKDRDRGGSRSGRKAIEYKRGSDDRDSSSSSSSSSSDRDRDRRRERSRARSTRARSRADS